MKKDEMMDDGKTVKSSIIYHPMHQNINDSLGLLEQIKLNFTVEYKK